MSAHAGAFLNAEFEIHVIHFTLWKKYIEQKWCHFDELLNEVVRCFNKIRHIT
jgi:hypothetical protein